MKENQFQSSLIKELEVRFPGCIILKNDATYIQGIPDLIILWGSSWAALECKRSSTASHRPNQEYYVDIMDKMSFASFICPETKQEVLDEMEQSFQRYT